MNFLNPAFLLALIAVAVPLVIHIFSRRRLPEIPFSTLRFLKRSDKRSMRRISLRRLLLLILRMAGIALLALAFARPVVRGELAALFPAGGSRAACILLDRSYSMGVEEDEGVLFRRAKAGLSAILENMGKDDEVSVVLFDNAVEIVYEAERLECEVISRSLKKAGPSWSGTDLRSAVEEGRRILKKSRREAKELYIVSDFQRSALGGRKGFEIYDREASEDAEKETKKPGVGGGEAQSIRAFLLPVQPEPGANVAVERILTPRIALHRGEITTLKVTLRNTSNALRARFPLEVLVDEHRIMEKEIEIPPGGVREENIIFPVERTGWIRGEVRKAMDRLPADDRRFFTLHVREKINVLLVADGSSLYLEQALSPEGADGDISLERRNWGAVTTADLTRAEVIVLGTGRGSLERDVELFDRLVRAGGKALILILPELEHVIRRMSRFSPAVEFRRMGEGFASIAMPRSKPRFLSPFEKEDLLALSHLKFRGAVVVSGVPDKAVLLRFRSGSPFMWEERLGEGTVVFAVIDPRPEANDLVLSPYFLPLVQQALLATGPEPLTGEENIVGEPIIWKGPFGPEPVCRLPDGTELKPEVRGRQGGRAMPGRWSGTGGISGECLLIPPVEEPGYIAIYDGSEVTGRAAVNCDCREESELSYMTGEEAADSLGLDHYLVIGGGRELSSSLCAAREGREISMPLLLAAVAVFLIELVVAQGERGKITD